MIPLGGYVKMKGQDDSDPTKSNYDDDSYTTKKPWQKIVISFAGPFANFLLAFILYIGIATMGMPKLLPVIGDLNQTQPAYQAGLKAEDKILTIDGKKIEYWEDIGEAIQKSPSTLHLTLLRGEDELKIDVTPKLYTMTNIFKEKIERKIIGITPDINSTVHYSFSPQESLTFAYEQIKSSSTMILKGMQKLFSGDVPLNQVSGMVGIVEVTAKATSVGIIALLFFTALISVNLGILNLLPIPALDGGHIMFNLYEMVTKRAPNEEVMYRLTIIGWGVLLSLMLLGLYNDIHRYIIKFLG